MGYIRAWKKYKVKGLFQYIYDAIGTKLKKTVSGGATTYYAGNYIYEDTGSGDVLKFFSHPEGYVEPSFQTERDGSQTLIGTEYVYQFKDYLGNIRLAYSDSNGNGSIATSEIIEENNYYPFARLPQAGPKA